MKKPDFFNELVKFRVDAFTLGGDMATDVFLGTYPEFTEFKQEVSDYLNAYEKIMDIGLKLHVKNKEDEDAKIN